MLSLKHGPRTIRAMSHVVRPVVEAPFRAGIAAGVAAFISFGTAAHAEPVHVVETSLFEQTLADETPIFRHLGLRIGPDDDFVEAHFGPGAGGDFTAGFLKTGKGKVADSTYLEVTPAGEVAMSKEEVLEWCREWAKDKEYVTLGQNCWHMVYTFLSTHEGCEISESLKFKEKDINETTQVFIDGLEVIAKEEGLTPKEVMQQAQQEPRKLLSTIFKRETLDKLLPEEAKATIQGVETTLLAAEENIAAVEEKFTEMGG